MPELSQEIPEGIIYSSGRKICSDPAIGLGFSPWQVCTHVDVYPPILSKSEIEVLDLLSEGPIEGLVNNELYFSGFPYETGWRDVFSMSYEDGVTGYLRSLYWNEIPVVSKEGLFNYQSVNVSWTNGQANGSVIDQLSPELTVSRSIGERLRGTIRDANNKITEDNRKYFRILNINCKGCTVNVKVTQLANTIVAVNAEESEASKLAQLGREIRTNVIYEIYYRPLFSENLYNVSSDKLNNASPLISSVDWKLGKIENIIGKINYGYVKASTILFGEDYSTERGFLGWEIMIDRKTPDSTSTRTRNITFIDSLTEVYKEIYTYPNSAIIRSRFNAEYFQSVPSRAFDVRLLKVKIPSTYDPLYRTYTESDGYWDGTFNEIKMWTDNPVWCYYDLITNKRYGLGKYIDDFYVDKFTLYQISKYCDVLVPDGFGSLEPRFTCNLILDTREDAFKVINDMSSIFRAMSYYGFNSIYTIQDSEKTPRMLFTNANVENGNFTYSTSSKRTRRTVAMVRYNDKYNFYKPAVEYVEDFEGIRRFGIREFEVSAFGCTSKSQAIRFGRWALLTERLQTETIDFMAGMEGSILRPGDVISVYDSNRKSFRNAGRITKYITGVNEFSLTLDSKIDLSSGIQYKFSIVAPTYSYDNSNVTDLNSSDTNQINATFVQTWNIMGSQVTGIASEYPISGNSIVRINSALNTGSYSLMNNTIWSIEAISGLEDSSVFNQAVNPNFDYYQIIKISEQDNFKYNINGLQYINDKFIQIESGIGFKQFTPQQVPELQEPTEFIVKTQAFITNQPIISYGFNIKNMSNIDGFRVFMKTGSEFNSDDLYNNIPKFSYRITDLSYNKRSQFYIPQETGGYFFRVYSVNNQFGKLSTGFASGNIMIDTVSPIQSVRIGGLSLSGASIVTDPTNNRLTAEYSGHSPTYFWQAGAEGVSPITVDFKYRISIRQHSTNSYPSDVIYYQNTGYLDVNNLNTHYTFDINTNVGYINGGARNYDIVVEAIDSKGFTSAGNRVLSSGVQNETWNNVHGYDMFYARNTKITGLDLYTGGQQTLNYQTNQWIDSNGGVHINFLNKIIPNDTIGSLIFISTGFFSGQDITGLIRSPYPIYTGEQIYDGYNQSFHAPYLMQNIIFKTGYVALAFYDNFDKALKERNISIQTGLYISNVVALTPQTSANITNTFNINIVDTNNSSSLTAIDTVDGVTRIRAGTIDYIIRSET